MGFSFVDGERAERLDASMREPKPAPPTGVTIRRIKARWCVVTGDGVVLSRWISRAKADYDLGCWRRAEEAYAARQG